MLSRHISLAKSRVRYCFTELGDSDSHDLGDLLRALDDTIALQRSLGALRKGIEDAALAELAHIGVTEVSTPDTQFRVVEKPLRPTYEDAEITQALVDHLVEGETRRNRKLPPLAVKSIVHSVAYKILGTRSGGAWSKKGTKALGVNIEDFEKNNNGTAIHLNVERRSTSNAV